MSEKTKFQMEFDIHASPKLLYQYISTPSGLAEWYADNVNSRTERFSFFWDDAEEKATLISKRVDQYVRFRWDNDEGTKYFFEMRIVEDELTKDVSLVVTDFADEDEVEESKMLWDSTIGDLKHVLGA